MYIVYRIYLLSFAIMHDNETKSVVYMGLSAQCADNLSVFSHNSPKH